MSQDGTTDIQRITEVEELDGLFEASTQEPVILFKHSLTCPISTAAYNEYLRFHAGAGGQKVRFTLVEVQRARPVSNAIAERTGVRHESPQALVLRDGAVAWHASHWSIKEESLRQALAS